MSDTSVARKYEALHEYEAIERLHERHVDGSRVRGSGRTRGYMSDTSVAREYEAIEPALAAAA